MYKLTPILTSYIATYGNIIGLVKAVLIKQKSDDKFSSGLCIIYFED